MGFGEGFVYDSDVFVVGCVVFGDEIVVVD